LENKGLVKARTANSSYPKVAVLWLNQAFYFYQCLCLVDNEVLRNRHLRVAAKRYAKPLGGSGNLIDSGFNTSGILRQQPIQFFMPTKIISFQPFCLSPNFTPHNFSN